MKKALFPILLPLLLASCATKTTSSNTDSSSSDNSPESSSTSVSTASSTATSNSTATSTQEDIDYVKVFCETSWTHVYAWVDSSNRITGEWPGDKLNNFDSDWKTFDFRGHSSLNIIFNRGKGGDQTEDLYIPSAGYWWYYQDEWYQENPLDEPSSSTSSTSSPVIVSDSTGLSILHCFDWKLSVIESKLSDIKAAGFNAIQTSPLQMPKDYNSGWNDESGQWWKLYQPLSFSIADTSWIGNENALRSLTSKAKSLGIKVIVDVVANHMSGQGTNPDWAISNYESDIYNNRENTFRSEFVTQSDSSVKATVWGNIGMPDLNTSNSTVQNRVYDYLKKLIDAGVDGFRFDAAKHIETSNDGDYASTFWENTLVKARSYAQNKNVDLFAYGEVLSVAGGNRKHSDYINYAFMDAITDSRTGDDMRKKIDAGSAVSSATYKNGLDPANSVLWAESHDTYMNDSKESTNVSQEDIDRTYALVQARPSSSLYFCRPTGQMASSSPKTHWNANIVKAANQFHIAMDGTSFTASSSGKVSLVERFGDKFGATIVNVSSSEATIEAPHLEDGVYRDLISGNNVTISSHNIAIGANKTLILVK